MFQFASDSSVVSALEFVIGHLHLIHSHLEATLDAISGTVALCSRLFGTAVIQGFQKQTDCHLKQNY